MLNHYDELTEVVFCIISHIVWRGIFLLMNSYIETGNTPLLRWFDSFYKSKYAVSFTVFHKTNNIRISAKRIVEENTWKICSHMGHKLKFSCNIVVLFAIFFLLLSFLLCSSRSASRHVKRKIISAESVLFSILKLWN